LDPIFTFIRFDIKIFFHNRLQHHQIELLIINYQYFLLAFTLHIIFVYRLAFIGFVTLYSIVDLQSAFWYSIIYFLRIYRISDNLSTICNFLLQSIVLIYIVTPLFLTCNTVFLIYQTFISIVRPIKLRQIIMRKNRLFICIF